MKSLTFPHALAYVFSAFGTLLPVLQTIAPALVPGPTGIAVAAGIGGVLALGHQVYSAYQTPVPGTAANAVVKLLPLLLTALLVGALLSGLSACKVAPTVSQRGAITGITALATGASIRGSSSDVAKWRARAVEFKGIAGELKRVNDAGSATLATLAADLRPLMAKLPPEDGAAVDAFVVALQPYIDAQLRDQPDAANVQTTVDVILAAVISTCESYGA